MTTTTKLELRDNICLHCASRCPLGSEHHFERAKNGNGWWVTITIWKHYGFPAEKRSWFSDEQAQAHFAGLIEDGAVESN